MSKTNISKSFLLSRLAILLSFVVMAFLSLNSSLSAQTVSQGYSSDEVLQTGLLVAAVENDPNKVEKVTSDTLDRLKGVVVQRNDSPVTLSTSGQNVFVANSGTYEVLVSDENGPIKKGDYISISSLAGIGMKAISKQPIALGQASEDFNVSQDAIGSTEDPKTKKKISFGRIETAVSIGRNPYFAEAEGNTIPKLLEKVSISIAGKPVNTARIWMATAVFIGTALMVGVMLYSGARSSLVSVGRNPLSRSIVIRGLLQIVVLSLIVFISGMFAVYLLLKV